MSFFTLLICLANYACHKGLGLSVKKIHQNIFKTLFYGRSLGEIQQQVSTFLDKELESLIYGPAQKRLLLAQKKGHRTIILSSSPDFLVAPIAHRLGVSDWKATQFSTNKNGYLKHISYLFEGEDKAKYMQQLAEKFDQPLSCMTFYSDSLLDLPAMKIAGKAVGVSPDRKLKKICQLNGWEIL